jgi:hypothetical protein
MILSLGAPASPQLLNEIVVASNKRGKVASKRILIVTS